MAGSAALGCVAQTITHCAQTLDGLIQLVRLGAKERPIDLQTPIRPEHGAYFVQAEPGGPSKRYQRQTLQDGGLEQSAKAAPTDGDDQAFLLIVP